MMGKELIERSLANKRQREIPAMCICKLDVRMRQVLVSFATHS